MVQTLSADIPRLEDSGHSRDSIVAALRLSAATPTAAVAFGAVYADAIEPDILAVLDRALRQNLDTPDQRLLFRGIHILGGRLRPAAYRPFIAFLRGPPERVEMLGDAVTEALPKILAGLFDGDSEPLRDLVTDVDVDVFVRAAGLRAMGTLCFDGRIEREICAAFLSQLDEESLIPKDDDFLWYCWMSVIGVLGIIDLRPRVRTAFADRRIHPALSSEKDFDRLLREASERPHDRQRLAEEEMGTIEDVPAELEKYLAWDDDEHALADDSGADKMSDDDLLAWATENLMSPQARNPYRDVGRNDPCPCGSGKKFKKCCL